MCSSDEGTLDEACGVPAFLADIFFELFISSSTLSDFDLESICNRFLLAFCGSGCGCAALSPEIRRDGGVAEGIEEADVDLGVSVGVIVPVGVEGSLSYNVKLDKVEEETPRADLLALDYQIVRCYSGLTRWVTVKCV